MSIGIAQKKIISDFKQIIDNQKKDKVDICLSAYSYVATWGENIGLENLKCTKFSLLNILKLNLTKIKDLYGTLKNYEYSLNDYRKKNFKKIIVSNSSLKNFNNDGSYTDRYLNINSNDHGDILFVLIVDNEIKIDVAENIILFSRKKNSLVGGLLFFVKNIYSFFLKNKSFKNFSHSFNFATILAKSFQIELSKVINFDVLERVLIPYEGIPYQQNFFRFIKKNNNKILTIGYDHSAPHSVPLHLFFREGAPDCLILNGESQKDFMVKNLEWSETKIKIAPSLRYKENSNEKFENILFLPWKIIDSTKILSDLKKYLEDIPDKFLNNVEVKTHPIGLDPKIQNKLKKEIEDLFKKNYCKFDQNIGKKISIFIGSTTGVIVALEKGIEVVHICFDPNYESYSQCLWPNIEVKKITKNIFTYKLKKRNSFILFGNNENNFEKYYLN